MSEYSKLIGEKEIICPHCGHNESYVRLCLEDNTTFGVCKKCERMTYTDLNVHQNNKPIVICPYCNSGNTRKITKASKIGGIALFGIFAVGKSTKEWHCNDCKSDF